MERHGTNGTAVAARWSAIGRPDIARILAGTSLIDEARLYERNVENYIGVTRVPIGIAGPLRIRGRNASGDYNIPLATTEATLVASYNRGAKLITEAGGCSAAVLEERIERSPAFVLRDLHQAVEFATWIYVRKHVLIATAERTSRHARCVAIDPIIEGNHVYVACAVRTGEAAGQNMVTIATAALCNYVVANAPLEITSFVIESNLSGDKKATSRALSGTRGKRVSADVRIPRDLAIARLHVEPKKLAQWWQLGAIGAAMSGAVGIQGHYANALTALAIATGQDPACVAESATGITRFEVDDRGDLYASVTLPNVVVGTVGGGTKLPTQRAGLELLASEEPLTARALAEIVAAIALAGELSISGAICANEFAQAHQRMARCEAT